MHSNVRIKAPFKKISVHAACLSSMELNEFHEVVYSSCPERKKEREVD